jgi:shikimate dehydrogenase
MSTRAAPRTSLHASVRRCPAASVHVGAADPRGQEIVVNATPLGMKPGDPLPVDAALLAPGTVVFDIITNPDPSPLMLAARARGCPAIGGRNLYEGQAVYAARFLGIPVTIEGRPAVAIS